MEICLLPIMFGCIFSAYKKGTQIIGSGKYIKDFVAVRTTQRVKLVSNNVLDGGNDKQIKAVSEYFRIK